MTSASYQFSLSAPNLPSMPARAGSCQPVSFVNWPNVRLSKEGTGVTLPDDSRRKALPSGDSSPSIVYLAQGPRPRSTHLSSPLGKPQATFSSYELPTQLCGSSWQHSQATLSPSSNVPLQTSFNQPQATVLPPCGHFCGSSAHTSVNSLPASQAASTDQL